MRGIATLDDADRAAVERQLGRPVRGQISLAHRCPCGLPAVIRTHPVVEGKPFPTLYWLTCLRACGAIGRLEGEGGMRELNERLERDPEFVSELEAAQRDYISRRDELHPLGPEAGGVGGGPLGRVKCLHAHYAHHLVCGCNPVGRWVSEQAGPLLHPPPCVELP